MTIRAKGKTLGQDRFSSSEFETEFYLFIWLYRAAWRIFVPQLGIKPRTMAVKTLNSNH